MSNLPAQQDWGVQNQNQTQPAPAFDFVGMLQRRFWIIILCLIFATGGGVFWYWKSEVKYTSYARVAIAVRDTQVSIVGQDGLPIANQVTAHDQIITSETVLLRAAKTIKFAINNGMIASTGNSDASDGDGSESGREKSETQIASATSNFFPDLQGMSEMQILGHLKNSIEVVEDKNDDYIYQLSYIGSTRNDCAAILGIVIGEYEAHLADKFKNEGDELLQNITQAKKGIDEKIKGFRKALEDWQRKNEEDVGLSVLIKDGIFVTNGVKENNYRTEYQQQYRDLREIEKQISDLQEDKAWMENAEKEGKSKQEVLAHINKFAEWMSLESTRKAEAEKLLKMSAEKKELLLPFEAPPESATLIQTRFSVQSMKREVDALIDKGFGEKHPDVKAAKRGIADLEIQVATLEALHKSKVDAAKAAYDLRKAQLEGEIETPLAELDIESPFDGIDLISLHKINLVEELNRLELDKAELEEAYEQKRLDAERVDLYLAEEQKLTKQIDDQQALNEILLQKISEISLEKDHNSGGYDFDILERPSFARQTEPSLMKVFAISTFLGIAIGTGLSYLIEIADKTFRNPSEIAQQLGMQVIGHVPVLSTKKVEANDSSLDDTLVTFHLPKSQQSEAFRAIRTSIFFNGKGKSSQIIQVTSPTPGDGKSTLAANLAVSLAQSGKKVLICDADLRRPTVHYLFGNDSDIGFTQVLKGEAEIEDAIADCDVDGLSIMPCGARPTNPSELLTSTRLYELFEVLREKFDYIIMDTPPMLAVTDPCAVAARADGVILAMRIKKNIKLSASRAKEILDSVNAPILGIVVNGAGMVQGNYSNSGAYGYGYGGYGSGYSSSYYSYGYDYGESTYYYDEDHKPTAKSKA